MSKSNGYSSIQFLLGEKVFGARNLKKNLLRFFMGQEGSISRNISFFLFGGGGHFFCFLSLGIEVAQVTTLYITTIYLVLIKWVGQKGHLWSGAIKINFKTWKPSYDLMISCRHQLYIDGGFDPLANSRRSFTWAFQIKEIIWKISTNWLKIWLIKFFYYLWWHICITIICIAVIYIAMLLRMQQF